MDIATTEPDEREDSDRGQNKWDPFSQTRSRAAQTVNVPKQGKRETAESQ